MAYLSHMRHHGNQAGTDIGYDWDKILRSSTVDHIGLKDSQQ